MASDTEDGLSTAGKWIVGVIIFIALGIILGQLFNLFPGVLLHHYFYPSLVGLAGLIILILSEALGRPSSRGTKLFHRVVTSVAEAFIVVSLVVFLFEIPHVQEFYEKAIRELMTKADYVEQLTPERQRELVRTVVAQRLGRAAEDSAAAEAFTNDLYQELDDGQYIIQETRNLVREWVDRGQGMMKSSNKLTREVRVTAKARDHKISDYVGGNVVYHVAVNGQVCYRVELARPGSARRPVPSQDKRFCEGTLVDMPHGRRITVRIPLMQGNHRVERVIRRQEEPALLGTTVHLDYFTQSLVMNFEYPRDVALEIYGHGDLEGLLDGVSTVTSREGDVNVFNQRLDTRWYDRGSSLVTLLSLAPRVQGQ